MCRSGRDGPPYSAATGSGYGGPSARHGPEWATCTAPPPSPSYSSHPQRARPSAATSSSQVGTWPSRCSSLDLPTSPYISPISPHISQVRANVAKPLQLPRSPYISLHLPISPYISQVGTWPSRCSSLDLPTSPYISLYLPISPRSARGQAAAAP